MEKLEKENERLKKALDLACEKVAALTGECPVGAFEVPEWGMPDRCERCGTVEDLECWRAYFIGKAEQ